MVQVKMTERAEILHLIEKYPKHFSKMIKNNAVLSEWVQNNTLIDITTNTWPAVIYSAIHGVTNVCQYGNSKLFNSINTGFKSGCGRTAVCKCVAESVANKVSTAKQNLSQEEKEKINIKRAKTNLEIYGVENIGQIGIAKAAHAAFYADPEKINEATLKNKATKLERYGNENYNNIEQITATFKAKYGTEYWIERTGNENYAILHDKDELTKFYKTHSVIEIVEAFNVHIQTVYRYLNRYGLREPFKSCEELEVVQFLESLGITNIIRNSRKLLGDRSEIDIFLPDYNIAIEYNGVYWHHESVDHITKTYHMDKFLKCEARGIQLLTIFSSNWKHKKEIVKKMIIHKLGLCKDVVFARKCKIVELPISETRTFLNENHIQGYCPASIAVGLKYNDQLVSIMTFGKQRPGQGAKEKEKCELIRFASSMRVVGGAGKLLKYFIKTYSPEKIMTYSDNEWSTGHLYKTLGFTLVKESAPSYWYVHPKLEKIMHRFGFNKKKLTKMGYDPNLTERQITNEMQLLKIWDCGKRRWELNGNTEA